MIDPLALCPDCREDYHCGGCACCTVEEDGQIVLFGTGELETRPGPDPHQAIHEAYLRWTHGGIEVVRDPMGRVA